MLIPKTLKKEEVTNPHRPNTGVPRDYTLCRVSWGTYYDEYDYDNHCMITEKRIMVDGDEVPEFTAILEATIPDNDRYWCKDKEVWLVRDKWKKFIVDLVKEYYQQYKIELRDWT